MDWRTWLEQSARTGKNPLESWDRAVDIGGNTLSGSDAGLVGKYWAINGGSRNEEWIRSNPTEFWQRQLRDAQNFFNNEMQHYGNVRADTLRKEQDAKNAELKLFQEQQQAVANQATAQQQTLYEQAVRDMTAQQQQTNMLLQQQQQAAAQAAATQEQQRMQAEQTAQSERLAAEQAANVKAEQEKSADWLSFRQGLALNNVDADRYAGESSEAAAYKGFLESQLGTAGFDAGNLLSGYDPTAAINAARSTTDGFLSYKDNLAAQNPTDYAASKNEALRVHSMYGQNLSQYDAQVRDQLSNLGQAYQAYNQLGDLNQAQGGTGQERVMSLLGINRPDLAPLETELSSLGTQYDKIARETEMLHGGEFKGGSQYQSLMGKWNEVASQFNPAAQGLLSTYGNAQNTLYGLYGDVNAVKTGRLQSEAQRQSGLINERSGLLSSLLGRAQQQATNIQNTYNETANRLRTSRVAEGQQIREQQTTQNFTDKQNRLLSLAATTMQKPAERTRLALRRTDNETQTQDPLGLSRGYSSLLGGF